MDLKAAIDRDVDVDMLSDSNDKTVQHTAHSDVHHHSNLPPGFDQGSSDDTDRGGGPSSRPSSDLEKATSPGLGMNYNQWRTDHLGTEFDHFGTDRGTTMAESSSSPTVKLAGQASQRHSSEDVIPMHSSVIQVVARLYS